MNTNKIIISFMLVFLIPLVAFGQQSQPGKVLPPVLNFESAETFSPDIVPSDSKAVTKENVSENNKANMLMFQLADPKSIYFEPVEKKTVETVTEKAHNTETTEPNLSVQTSLTTTSEMTTTQLKEEVPVAKPIVKIQEVTETSKTTEIESPKLVPEIKLTDQKTSEASALPAEVNLPTAEPIVKTQEVTETSKTAESESPKLVPEIKLTDQKTLEASALPAKVTSPSSEITTEQLSNSQEGSKSSAESESTSKLEEKAAENTNIVTTTNSDNIDYYLKKYTSTLQGEAQVSDYKYSLMEPFKQSLFFQVLTENKYQNIELQTQDITADFKPEGIVSYNIPLGAEGEYACQIMVLEPEEKDLTKLWISEQVPGEIDSVMIQDVNNDAQNDIVLISTTGGVSLLKSIRVYTYDKLKNAFTTAFAMNGIMEGIINVRQGKILISETFPGGINRAALYVWNGKRFERLEL